MDRREPVAFLANTPEQVSFKYPDGKVIDTAFGQKTMYSLTDGRVLFAESELAYKINFCEPQPGDVLWITKRMGHAARGKGRRITWEVSTTDPEFHQAPPPKPPDTRRNAAVTGIEESDLERQLRESHELREKAANRNQAKENITRNPLGIAGTNLDLTSAVDGTLALDAPPVEKKAPQMAQSSTPAPQPPAGSRPAWYVALVSQTKDLVDALAEVRLHAEKHGQRVSFDDCEKLLVTSLIGKQRQRA